MSLVILKSEILGAKLVSRGKVRDTYEVSDDFLFIVTTDRISAFDVVMPNGIPEKGMVLNQMTAFWLEMIDKELGIPTHFMTADFSRFTAPFGHHTDLEGRSMLVQKAKPLPVECIVRGYLSGSGWKDYQKTGKICGIDLPKGLQESDKLPEPIFTPSTKAELGIHDENISFVQMQEIIGLQTADKVRQMSLDIYRMGANYALERGIIIADTKFEFGRDVDEHIILIDEVLTPDSSRFWPADDYEPGRSQNSFYKQFLRDYLESIGWNKQPPAPELPNEVIKKTQEKYLEALRRLTDMEVPVG